MTKAAEKPAAELDIYAAEAAPETSLSAAASRNPKLLSLPVEITVSVGAAQVKISDLLALGPDSLLKLPTRVEDPVDLYVGARKIARGMLAASDDDASAIVVRVTEVLDAIDEV